MSLGPKPCEPSTELNPLVLSAAPLVSEALSPSCLNYATGNFIL